ncbi:MAG: hypothetical protein KJ077_20560 [Anaerolineae bacterium]|nr:hypothetical protein [Anaerolineae bacterium]
MATTAGTLPSETSISKRILWWSIALFGIFIVTGVLLAFNYWVAVIFFFVSLLILVRFGLEEYQGRGLCLLLVLNLFIAALVGSLVLLFLSNDQRIPQLAQSSALANIFFSNSLAIVFTSILIGILAAIDTIVLFLLLVAMASIGILRWHKTDREITFGGMYWHLLSTLLGMFHFWVVVDDFEIKGSQKDKERLDNYGGPGWITVYPGHVVVLHKWGKITRAVGLGSTMLKHAEQVKAVLPIRPKGGISEIKNVLTRDRIPLTITVLHAVQVDPAGETKARLEQVIDQTKNQLEELKVIGKSLPEKIEDAEKRLEKAEKDLSSTLETDVEKRKFQQQAINDAKKQLDDLKSVQESLPQKIKDEEKRLKQTEEGFSNLPEAVANIRTSLQQDVDRAKKQLEEALRDNEYARNGIKDAQKHLKAAEKRLNVTMKTVAGTKNRLQQLVSKIRIWLQAAQHTLGQSTPAIENTQKRLEEVERNLSDLRTVTAQIRRDLLQAVDEARKQLRDATKYGKSTEDKVEDARRQLKEAENRLRNIKDSKNDNLIGDSYNQCYESIAELVAIKSPDVWESLKSPVERNLRDAIMSEDFESLFNIDQSNKDLAERIDQRKISEIEKVVFDKAKQSQINDGIVLRVVDITQIRFPEEIEERIKAEVTALAEARIKNTEADTKQKTAIVENKIMLQKVNTRRVARVTEARGELEAAKIRAEAAKIQAQSRAEQFKQIIQVLRQQNQSEETIKTILQHIVASNATLHYIRSEQTINPAPKPNGNHKPDLREQQFA